MDHHCPNTPVKLAHYKNTHDYKNTDLCQVVSICDHNKYNLPLLATLYYSVKAKFH